MTFGDTEPEDAWDPDDTLDVLIDNLRRRIEILDGNPVDQWGQGTIAEQLDRITALLDARQRRLMTPRERMRAIDLIEDLYLVRERLRTGR